MDITTFTTLAWLSPRVSADMQPTRTLAIHLVLPPASTHIPSSTPARRASCSFRCHAPFSMLSPVFIHRTDDRNLGGIKVYVPTCRTKSSLLPVPSGSLAYYTLFFPCFLYVQIWGRKTNEEDPVSPAVVYIEGMNISYYLS